MKHIAGKNVHLNPMFHCGSDWGEAPRVMNEQAERDPFASLISHQMGLADLVKRIGVVVNPDECMKVEVVPHKQRTGPQQALRPVSSLL